MVSFVFDWFYGAVVLEASIAPHTLPRSLCGCLFIISEVVNNVIGWVCEQSHF